jgi:CHASE3 domain sensor protein
MIMANDQLSGPSPGAVEHVTTGAWASARVAPRERSGLHRRWIIYLPLALVIVSLVSAAIVPLLVQRRIAELRNEILSAVDPARQLVTELQGAVTLEVAAARGFLLTGDQDFAARHHQARSWRRQTEARLLLLAERLGPPVHAQVLGYTEQLRRADARLDSLFDGRVSRREYRAQLREYQTRLEATVTRASNIDEAILRVAGVRLVAILAAERLGVVLTVLLVLLALVAALLVARLGRGYRLLALRLDESEARLLQIADRERAALKDAEEARAAAEQRREAVQEAIEFGLQGPELLLVHGTIPTRGMRSGYR